MPTLKLIPTPCNTPVIELHIANAPHKFIIDTGATNSILAVSFANIYKYKRYFMSDIAGITGVTDNILRVDLQFNFCGVSIYSLALYHKMDKIKLSLPFPISGLIGQDILSQFSSVTFDYKNKQVRFVV